MKTLLILRHAKSSHDHPGISDRDRPLNKRGRHDAPRVGALLQEKSLIPDRILSSNAKRTQETTELLTTTWKKVPPVELHADLYLAPPINFIRLLNGLNESVERPLVVGHNPGLEVWVNLLGCEETSFPTAALACFELPIPSWSELKIDTRGTLKLLWYPKEAD